SRKALRNEVILHVDNDEGDASRVYFLAAYELALAAKQAFPDGVRNHIAAHWWALRADCVQQGHEGIAKVRGRANEAHTRRSLQDAPRCFSELSYRAALSFRALFFSRTGRGRQLLPHVRVHQRGAICCGLCTRSEPAFGVNTRR